MSSFTTKQIIFIVIFFLVLGSIPLGLVLVKESQIFKSSASGGKPILPTVKISTSSAKAKTTPQPVPSSSPLTELQKLMEAQNNTPLASPTAIPSSIPELVSGPSLNFKVNLEGRPENKQAAKLFIGIGAGVPVNNPTYLLSFTVDLPETGIYQGLSLAGLTTGNSYTAYLKGPAQITNALEFTAGNTETDLNDNQVITLLSGDLNDDNIINTTDYTIAKAVYGSTPSSSNWNTRVDFNLDEVINNLDLGLILKNFGQTGQSGAWYSTPSASPSASSGSSTSSAILVSPSVGSPAGIIPEDKHGYWLWIP